MGREDVGVLTTLPTSPGMMAINRDFTMIHWIGLRENLQETMVFNGFLPSNIGLSCKFLPSSNSMNDSWVKYLWLNDGEWVKYVEYVEYWG